MIVLCDIDGCLTEGRNRPIDLIRAAELKQLIQSHDIQFVLASGRSQAYMECMSQVLDLNTLYICENGAAIYDPEAGKYIYKVQKASIAEVKTELNLVFGDDVIYEPNKEFSLSFRLENRSCIDSEVSDVLSAITIGDGLHLTNSNSAIDITPEGCSKGIAMKWLVSEYFEAGNKRKIVGFGDAENDLDFLQQCEFSGAPRNCSDTIRKSVDFVSGHDSINGLLDFIKRLVS